MKCQFLSGLISSHVSMHVCGVMAVGGRKSKNAFLVSHEC